MSRCFPFPPPGYVKTARPDAHLASPLLDKEKHKEKKHKKDKKDKDKKEKKDKERSKDKHRDKKDRKEKHKDKKKDKSKDKSRESEGTDRHGEALLGQKFGESSRKSEEIKDPIFREELVRKTQDQKGVENRAVNNFTISNDRSREGFSAAPALENDRTAVNKMRIHSIDASRRSEGLGQQTITINQQKNGTSIRRSENLNSSSQGGSDGFSTTPMVEKERVKVTRPPSNSTDSVPRKEGTGQRISNISILVQKRTESPNKETAKKEIGTSSPLLRSPANALHKGNGKVGRPVDSAPTSMQRFESPSTSGASTGMDRSLPRSTIPSPSITIRRPNGMVRPTENFSISATKPNAGGVSPAMGKEKGPGGRMPQNTVSADQKLVGAKPPAVGKEKEPGGRVLHPCVSTDQKQVDSKSPAVEKIAVGRAERVEKVRDGASDDTKKEDKKRERHEKKKRKEKHKEKKKEKEAKKEKQEHNHKEHDKLRENSIDYQIDSLIDSLDTKPLTPPLAPPADDAKVILADENLKKRKNHEMNGYLQNHHEMRPTKLPRPAPSSNHVENGTASHVAAPPSSMKPDAMKIEKAERLPKKEEKVNGNKEAQQRPSLDSGLRDPLPNKKEEKVNGNKEAQQRPLVDTGLRDPLPKKEEKANVNKEAQQRPQVVTGLRDPLPKKEEKVTVSKEAQQRPAVVSGLRDPLPKKEEKVTVSKEAQQRPAVVSGHRDPGASSGNGAPARKSAHPDFKYLGQIYSIPEAPQIMECDYGDQDWLFDRCSTQPEKPKMETEADGVPQVWAEAMKIDPADVIALPYVIPF
ncbi:hypothetical protein VPH35_101584 [Triticum aestivum]|uniref:Uncharacterized protein n=1 Tax=Triticum aestivum TaxID=4565 RepID=A0A3B6N110_WHEAT|nr:serine/arginine repetitive matrix protein 1-like [Triticum aestivum]